MPQLQIPGTSGRIKALEDLATALLDLADKRAHLKVAEDELKIKLVAAMRKAHKTVYVRDGLQVEIVERGALVKVKGPKVDVGDDEEPDDDEAS